MDHGLCTCVEVILGKPCPENPQNTEQNVWKNFCQLKNVTLRPMPLKVEMEPEVRAASLFDIILIMLINFSKMQKLQIEPAKSVSSKQTFEEQKGG